MILRTVFIGGVEHQVEMTGELGPLRAWRVSRRRLVWSWASEKPMPDDLRNALATVAAIEAWQQRNVEGRFAA